MYIQPKVTVDIATVQSPGIVKPDGNTITIDSNGTITSSVDLTDYIEKSSTEGLVMNDGTIDTSKHVHLKSTGSELTGELQAKTWIGLTSFSGYYIWTDGDNIYYSKDDDQYVLNKSTSTWSTKTWGGFSFDRGYVWTDGDNIYYSKGNKQLILDKSTSTWSKKTWSGLTNFSGVHIWTDGDNIYYSGSSEQYVLDKSTSTWSAKTWSGLTRFQGLYIWTDGDNIYYSNDSTQYVLDKSTSTWSAKTWTGYTSIRGNCIWTDGDNIYYSYDSEHYVLDKSTSTWSTKTWSGMSSFYGSSIWTDGDNIYYSSGSDQYIFKTEGVYADGLVKSDGTIDTNTYLPSSSYKELSKKRYTITATNWSNEVDVNGYYTYTVTLSNPTLSTTYAPAVYLTGADDNTFYTDTEYDMYSYLDQCNLTTTSTLVLYATQKPDNNFYIFIEGKAS